MKRKFLFIEFGIIVVLVTFMSSFGLTINYTKATNNELYQDFYEEELVDSGGEVNLSEREGKRDQAYQGLKDVSGAIDVDGVNAAMNKIEESNQSSNTEIDNLINQVNQLNGEIDNLEQQYQILDKKYREILRIKEIRRQQERINNANVGNGAGDVYIANFPTMNQYPTYQTGCESVALTLLLRYYGVGVSADSVISNLARQDLPYLENGVRYGGNPELGFLGDPYSIYAYGVYEMPIANVANMYKGGVVSRSNFPFSEVLNLVSQGKPVVVWTSMGLSAPYISSSWIYKPTGETISWKAGEHAVVVIGYNDNNVIISDPMGGQIRYQSRSLFEARYNYFGRKAVYYP